MSARALDLAGSQVIIKCLHCRKRLDIKALSMKAQKMNLRKIRCPYCHEKVATVN